MVNKNEVVRQKQISTLDEHGVSKIHKGIHGNPTKKKRSNIRSPQGSIQSTLLGNYHEMSDKKYDDKIQNRREKSNICKGKKSVRLIR